MYSFNFMYSVNLCLLPFVFQKSKAFVFYSGEESEIPFEVIIPEGLVPFEWVADVVIRVTAAQLDIEPEQISLKKRFQKDLNADSLDIVEICVTIEKMLGIVVPDFCLGWIYTVDDASRIAHHLLNNGEISKEKKIASQD